jgi:hypothetical protein
LNVCLVGQEKTRVLYEETGKWCQPLSFSHHPADLIHIPFQSLQYKMGKKLNMRKNSNMKHTSFYF